MDEFERLVVRAYLQADKEAEQTLDSYRLQNYGEYVKAFADLVAGEGRDPNARAAAAMGIKTLLAAQSPQAQIQRHDLWKKLQPEIRAEVKDKILRTLLTPQQPHLARVCAVAAAEIAAVELPFNEWQDFVPKLNVTSQPVDDSVKIAALVCLGFTCDRLATIEDMVPDVPALAPETSSAMLGPIIDGAQGNKSDNMRIKALKALRNSLVYIRGNMETKQERDIIMEAVCNCSNSPNADLRKESLSTIDAICEDFYDFMADYMPAIYTLTTEIIKGDPDEDAKMNAIEIWTTLAAVEQSIVAEEQQLLSLGLPPDRPPCPKYVHSAAEQLVPLLLRCLTSVNEEIENDDWTIQASASLCLENISIAMEGLVLRFVLPFVSSNIRSQEWQLRDAAIVAFMSVQDGPSTEELGRFVSESLELMLAAFDDPSRQVQSSAMSCLATMCKLHFAAFSHEQISAIINASGNKLRDTPKLALHACTLIHDVAFAVGKDATAEPPQTNVLSQPMLNLVKTLLNTAEESKGAELNNLRVAAMSTVSSLVSASAIDSQLVLVELFPFIVKLTRDAVNISPVSADDKFYREQELGSLFGIIQTMYQRMDTGLVLHLTDEVMTILIEVLKDQGTICAEDALGAIGAIASNLETEFAKYMDRFTPILVGYLKMFNVESVLSVAVGICVDIFEALGTKLVPYANDIMQVLMDCLRDGSVMRDIKPAVVAAFGDMAMAVQSAYEPYLSMTQLLLMQASQQQAESPDMLEFINALRASVLEAYSGIVYGLDDGGRIDLLIRHNFITPMMQFLSFLANDTTKDEEVLKKAVVLVGDLARTIGHHPSAQLQQDYILRLIRQGEASQDEEVKNAAQFSLRHLRQLP